MPLRRYLNLIVFEHSVFALPFSFVGFILAYRSGPLENNSTPLWLIVLLVALCTVSARTAAMAFNRLIDLRFDRANTRTANRELVVGKVTLRGAWTLVLSASAIFFAAAAMLGKHCLILAPLVLAFLFFYSFSKRFTAFSHLILGGALALAPAGAWWVLRPQVELPPLLLMFAVAFWVAGFDIIYSTQDEAFDKAAGLHSVPSAVGVPAALNIARFCHLIALLLLFGVGLSTHLPVLYFAGLFPVALMFVYQHRLVSPADLSRVNRAFFTVNGWVSVYYLLLVLVTGAK